MIQGPHRNYNRRDALRLGAAAALTPLFTRWAAAAQDAKDSATFTFIVANDIHYFDKRCAAWLGDHVIKRMNDHKADFCAIVGDMSEDGTKEQNTAIRDVLKGLTTTANPSRTASQNRSTITSNTAAGSS
jgi:ABC-type sugar transport system substrate-binding protein